MTNIQTPIIIPFEVVNDKDVTLIKWLHESGKYVSKNEIIAIIETSKINVDLVAPTDGFLMHVHNVGAEVPVGTVIGYLNTAEEVIFEQKNIQDFNELKEINIEKLLTEAPIQISKNAKAIIIANKIDPTLFFHLPLVKESDVLDFLKTLNSKKLDVLPIAENYCIEGKKINRSKRTEIENLTVAKKQTVKSLVTSLIFYPYSDILKNYLQDNRLALYIFETARLLRQFSELNSYYNNGLIYTYPFVNIAFAVDAGFGLKTLTIKNADEKSFLAIQNEIFHIVNRYLDNALLPEDFEQASFTISDLSAEGIFYFDPLLSHQQSGILGIGSDHVIPNNNFAFSTLILSFDHQVTEGKRASQFLAALKSRLLSHIELHENVETSNETVWCISCHRSFQELQSLNAKLLSHYVSIRKTMPICSICLGGWE